MLAVTTRKQVVIYIPDDLYEDLREMKSTDPRLSMSELGEKAIRIALPSLKKEFAPFPSPTQGTPGKRRRAA